jgi:hypothetical protein
MVDRLWSHDKGLVYEYVPAVRVGNGDSLQTVEAEEQRHGLGDTQI